MRKLLGLLLIAMPIFAAAQSGIDGTWHFDPNKAKLDTKPQVYELKGGTFSCSTCDPKITVKADGTEQKETGSPYADMAKVTVIDDKTVERVAMKDGKVVFRDMIVVSADGKTLNEKVMFHAPASDQDVNLTAKSTRIGEPEAGAHAISGSWKPDKIDTFSDNGLTFTYSSNGDGLNYKAKTGENYSAKFDGKDYPFKGDPGTTSVALKKVDDHTFEETYKRNGEVIGHSKMTVSADGKSLTAVYEDKRRGVTDTWVAERDMTAMADK